MRRKQCGASLLEYSLLVALLAVVSVGAMSVMGNSTAEQLCLSSGAIQSARATDPAEFYWDEELGECLLCTGGFGGEC